MFVVGFALPAAAAAAAAAHFSKKGLIWVATCVFLLNTFVFLWKRLGRSGSSTSHKRNSVNSFRPRVESLFVFTRYHTFSPENVCLNDETRATDKVAPRYCVVVVVVVCWLLFVGCCLLVVGCWLLLLWLLVVGCWMLLETNRFENSFLFVFRHTDGKCVFTC